MGLGVVIACQAMLAREVEAPIFARTREWLATDPDAYFYLVLDELHLIRGPSSPVVGRDALDASILSLWRTTGSSSPSLLSSADRSLKYLDGFFGPFGTSTTEGDDGFRDRSQWADA
jgi:hypothetical protein